jgi:hypothetical protein
VGAAAKGRGAPAYWPWTYALRVHIRCTQAEIIRAQLGNDLGFAADAFKPRSVTQAGVAEVESRRVARS